MKVCIHRGARQIGGTCIELHRCHTSGHASVPDLQRLRQAFAGAVAVPIHTQHPDLYESLFGHVHLHADGEWWEV